MTFAETLFEIAKQDLEAAKCLFERGFYPQAVFYLQQSVEKATKSFGLLSNVIKEDELTVDIGHNPLNVYKKSIEEQKDKLDKINCAIEKVPKLRETKIIKKLNIRMYQKKIPKALDWVVSLNKGKEEILFIQKSEIRSVIRELDKLESELEIFQETTITLTEEILNEFREAFIEFLDSLNELRPQKIENEKRKLEGLDLNLMKEVIRIIQSAPIRNAIYITHSLFYLSSIMLPHAIVTRYPERKHDPLKIYNKNLPLIQLFNDVVEIMEKTLSKLENLLPEKVEEVKKH